MSHDKKPDFSNVQGGARSTERMGEARPDFDNVRGGVRSTEEITDAAGARSYTVAEGDTLSHIAKAHYGRASKWRAIFEANRNVIDDPDRIYPGQVLVIPPLHDEDEDGGHHH